MEITIYSTSPYEKPYLQAACKKKHKVHYLSKNLSKQTASLAKGSEAVVIFTNDDASADVLEALHENGIKYLATRTMGTDHIDTDKAKELGIKVANVPHYSPYSVAEHSIALMLALNRKLVAANRKIREHNFQLDGLVGFDMKGKTVGLLGAGEIGAISAGILHGFGCKILAFDIKENQELINKYDAKYVEVDTLCRESNIISIHAPLNKDTHHLINREQINKMKKGVMLINVARGGIMKTEDVIEGLKNGQIGYLGMDVYEHEDNLFFQDRSTQVLQDDLFARLLTFKNVLITGHQAFLTQEALKDDMEATFSNLNAWAKGEKTENEL